MSQQDSGRSRAVRLRYMSVSWCRLCLGCGLRYLLSWLHLGQANAFSMSRAVLVLWRASPQRASVQVGLWLELISILEC